MACAHLVAHVPVGRALRAHAADVVDVGLRIDHRHSLVERHGAHDVARLKDETGKLEPRQRDGVRVEVFESLMLESGQDLGCFGAGRGHFLDAVLRHLKRRRRE